MNKPLVDVSLNQFDESGFQQVFAISPFGASETRQERLDRLEKLGMYDPDCGMCQHIPEHPSLNPFMPSHLPLSTCRSGKRPHCTCDSCF